MKKLNVGDRVIIVAGSYKGKQGTYKRIAGDGTKSAAIAIDGDTVKERTLRLTSLKKAPTEPTREELLREIADLTTRLQELEVRVQQLE